MQQVTKAKKFIKRNLKLLQKSAIEKGLNEVSLENINYIINYDRKSESRRSSKDLVYSVVLCCLLVVISFCFWDSFVSARCLLSSNYLLWEATRPLADCSYCANVSKPIILRNITRRDFKDYAYSSKPIVIKNAIKHWRASKEFSFDLFKTLYEETDGSYKSIDQGCQFLNFKTDLYTLQEVFSMPEARVSNGPEQKPWYVGWGNCHPDILSKLRQYYKVPEFFPSDAEFPATENIFIGYEMGAVMHLDYIPRLMWQGQVRGNKSWTIAPVSECDSVCQKFDFYVEPGDVVLLDTRVWYHATSIAKGEFSITVQSEYG